MGNLIIFFIPMCGQLWSSMSEWGWCCRLSKMRFCWKYVSVGLFWNQNYSSIIIHSRAMRKSKLLPLKIRNLGVTKFFFSQDIASQSQGSQLGFLFLFCFCFFTWSTGPRNLDFYKIIESLWKLCGTEMPKSMSKV